MALLVISYSRTDQPIVRVVVKLLQTAMRDVIEKAVFWDDDFEPGDPWFEQIKAYIDEAPQLFVFWCDHSSTSAQVKREFQYAFQKQKHVVPVLLDDTPLSPELSSIHGIDVRGAIKHNKRPVRAVSWRHTLYIVAAALVFGAVFTYLVQLQVGEKVADRNRQREQLLSSRVEPDTPVLVEAFLQSIPSALPFVAIEIHAPPSASDAASFIEQYIESRRPEIYVYVVEARSSEAILLRTVEPVTIAYERDGSTLDSFSILFLTAGVSIVLYLLLVGLKRRKRRQIIVEAFSEHLATDIIVNK